MFRGSRLAVLLPVCAAAGVVACAEDLPPPSPLGEHRKQEQQQVLATPYDDRRVGAQQAQAAAEQYGLVEDAKALAYVSQVGQRLARHAPGDFEYRFQIVNQDEPNAFALPGGYVFVTRGLLVLVNSEDELANVIGHEITHVAERHAAMQQAAAGAPQMQLPKLVQIAGEGVDLANGQLGQSPRAWLAQYGRDEESDADRIGQRIASDGGWSPQGMSDFLRDLESAMRLQQGESHAPNFLDSHPSNPDRITAAALNASLLQWAPSPPIAADRAAFLAKLDGLVVGDDPGEGLFQGSLFVQPDLGFALAFPEGWETQNTHTAVAAVSPTRDVELLFEGQGPGADPKAAADAFFAQAPPGAKLVRKGGALEKVAGSPAWHEQAEVRTANGILDMDITWLIFGGNVYRVTGVGEAVGVVAEQPAIQSMARSLRPLDPAEKKSVRVKRLRSAPARAGESLEAFSARTGNTWKPSDLAVANDVFVDATLADGQLLKIAVEEAYAPPAASGRP
jgi:predicted Zn-dependent protease